MSILKTSNLLLIVDFVSSVKRILSTMILPVNLSLKELFILVSATLIRAQLQSELLRAIVKSGLVIFSPASVKISMLPASELSL